MKIALYGKKSEALEKLLSDRGIRIVRPEEDANALILCYGGDGAMLGAELRYPGRLKMPVRDCETAPHCPKHSLEWQLDAMLSETDPSDETCRDSRRPETVCSQ